MLKIRNNTIIILFFSCRRRQADKDRKKAAGEETLLVSAGDFMGGTIYNWLAMEGYAPELDLMRHAGVF